LGVPASPKWATWIALHLGAVVIHSGEAARGTTATGAETHFVARSDDVLTGSELVANPGAWRSSARVAHTSRGDPFMTMTRSGFFSALVFATGMSVACSSTAVDPEEEVASTAEAPRPPFSLGSEGARSARSARL
jgi:hypothetical protein